MQKVTSFFLFCSGSDVTLLKRCPTETNKYVGIGAAIFFTGLFAALSGGYALYTVFDNVFAASLFGVLWGLMIFNLDRYIVSGMRKEGSFGREFVLALPRIILAVVISIVIAKPLELKIFEKEIAPELILMEQEKFALQEQLVRTRFAIAQDSLAKQIHTLRNQIQEKARSRDALVRLAQEEADGTGGSGKRNPGPIYKIKKADADRAEAELSAVTQDNSKKIELLEQTIAANNASITSEISAIERKKINGPAARMEALDRITDNSDAIRVAHWFIMLLFIVVETAPVFVKLISSKGPYDNLLRVEEHGYFVAEVENISRANAHAKTTNDTLPEYERKYLKDQLDASL